VSDASRRAWIQQATGLAAWGALAALAGAGEALAQGDARGRAWWRAFAQRCAAARAGGVAPTAWQQDVEAVFREVSAPWLMASLPVARFEAGARLGPRRGPRVEELAAPTGLTATEGTACRRRLFALGAGRAVVPHGHTSLASAFVLLRGSVRVTHFDRRPGEAGTSIVTPTIDRVLRPGDCSTISDERDNVHWLRAGEAPALLLNVSVEVPSSGRFGDAPRGRVYLDVSGTARADGTTRARHLSYAEATARFG
jgi:hypothetical protein